MCITVAVFVAVATQGNLWWSTLSSAKDSTLGGVEIGVAVMIFDVPMVPMSPGCSVQYEGTNDDRDGTVPGTGSCAATMQVSLGCSRCSIGPGRSIKHDARGETEAHIERTDA